LVDAEGRLVGLNTMIISRTGGNQGLGFAIPSNMVRSIVERLMNEGKVIRGYLGVYIQDVTAELAKEFGLEGVDGALIGGVEESSPAAKSDLEEGDIILQFNGKPVVNSRQLRIKVAQTPPETKVRVDLVRNGKRKTVHVTLGELDQSGRRLLGGRQAPSREILRDVELSALTRQIRRQHDFPSVLKGIMVMHVEPGTPADHAGLRAGEVIVAVNRQSVGELDDLDDRLRDAADTDSVLLRVWSDGGHRFLVLRDRKP